MTKRSRCQSSSDFGSAATKNVVPTVASTTPSSSNPAWVLEEEETAATAVNQVHLFSPLLQHYISIVPPPPAMTTMPSGGFDADDSNNATLDSNEVVNGHKERNRTASTVQQRHGVSPDYRYEVLKSFVFPSAVSDYLCHVSLLPPPTTTCTTTVASATTCVTESDDRKRLRVEVKSIHNETEDGFLYQMRSIAEVRLSPFLDDSEFIAAHEMLYVWKDWAAYTSSVVSGNGQLQRVVSMAHLDIFQQCRPCQSAAVSLYTHHISVRLQKMRLSPRIVRVAQRLHLEQQELAALTYLLVCHCGSAWPHVNSGGSMISPGAVAWHNNLNSFQLMHFLADYREHIKQGIIISDMKFKASFMENRLTMPQEAIAALSGDNLSEEQLIKLEKTALAEVLLTERSAAAATVTSAADGGDDRGDRNVDNMEELENRNGNNINNIDNIKEEGTEDGEAVSSGSSCSVGSTPRLEPFGMELGLPENAIGDVMKEQMHVTLASQQQRNQEQQKRVKAGRNGSVASSTSMVAPVSVPDTDGHGLYAPYATDIDYMDESFKLLANVVRLHGAESDMKDEDEAIFMPKNKVEATMRELRGKVRVATAIHRARTAATLKSGKFIPRIEALSQRLQLSDLEKRILLLLVGNIVSHDVLVAINGRYVMRDGQRVLTVGYILFVLCDTLQERVAARKSFYQSGALLLNGVVSLSLDNSGRTCFNTDLMDYIVDIDRKIVDHLMGTEMETAEMVPGSRLYTPEVPMQNVVLPQATTDLVLTTIKHYGLFEECKHSCGFGEGLGASMSGLVFLFYGPSGTGKTMLANAVAYELQKRILLVNLLHFKSDAKAPEMLRFIFREAKLNDAMIFFDECESVFESRETNPLVTSILAEFEKYDGLVILATNKAQVMDEAMNRRISLMVEFRLPDQQMREQIWRAHIPRNLQLHENVSVLSLALNYELSGGLIRNAMLTALGKAVARERTATPTLCMQDLEEGARLQLRGLFLAAEKPHGATTESYITPKRPLSDLVVDPQTWQQLDSLARLAKGRNMLFSQWGFNEEDCADQGSLYLFHGPSGTGKSLAAEGIAYECAVVIRLCNVAELLLIDGLKVHAVFNEARKLGAIIVFDEAQVLFNHSEQSIHVARLIHYHAMRYPRPVIFIATTGTSDMTSIDVRATPLVFMQEIVFRLPTPQLRRELWRRSLPEKMPTDAKSIDLDELSEAPVSAKLIRAAAFSACCRVAMLGEGERRLTMQMLREELENMQLREKHRHPHSLMFA